MPNVAATRTLQGWVVNVKDHGAKGNGITDDTAALRAAIAASREGHAVYFPPGTYVVTQPLQPKAHQLYFSLGDRATLKARPAKQGFPLFDVRSCPVEFRHLGIDGSRDKKSRPSDLATAPGIWVRPDNGPVRVVVSGCRIRNTHGDGIRIGGGPDADRGSDRVIVRDTVVKDCGWQGNGNGLGVGRVDNVRVESSTFEGCHNGIKMLDCHDVVVHGVTAAANRRNGIAFTFSHRWHVDHCTARDNGSEADGSAADDSEARGGWGIAAGGEPIEGLARNSDFTITNNVCEGNANGGITLDPTEADDPMTGEDESAVIWAQRARVSGNVCRGRHDGEQSADEGTLGSHGIHVRNSSAVVVTDNLCYQNNRSGIAVVNSSHVLVQGNACYQNLNGIGVFNRDGIEDAGGHVIGVNMLYDNRGEDINQ